MDQDQKQLGQIADQSVASGQDPDGGLQTGPSLQSIDANKAQIPLQALLAKKQGSQSFLLPSVDIKKPPGESKDYTPSHTPRMAKKYVKTEDEFVSRGEKMKKDLGKQLLLLLQKQKQMLDAKKQEQQEQVTNSGSKVLQGLAAGSQSSLKNKLQISLTNKLIQVKQNQVELASGGIIGSLSNYIKDVTKTSKSMETKADEVQKNACEELLRQAQKIKASLDSFKNTPFEHFKSKRDQIVQQIEKHHHECINVPPQFKKQEVYKKLKNICEQAMQVIVIAEYLAKESIQARHWDMVNVLTQAKLPYKSINFALSHLLTADLIDQINEIEEISQLADKQFKIETQLNKEIIQYWQNAEIEITTWNDYKMPCVFGSGYSDIIDKLENDQVALQQMSQTKVASVFKSEIEHQQNELTKTKDTLNQMYQLQKIWQGVAQQFKSEDVKRKISDAINKFDESEKQWFKLMQIAAKKQTVISICLDHQINNLIEPLQNGFDQAQNSLNQYFEIIKKAFPKFYICSDDQLKGIITQGSDPRAITKYLSTIFDAVDKLSFDKQNKDMIIQVTQSSPFNESIELEQAVLAQSQPEIWLSELELQIVSTIKSICKKASHDLMSSIQERLDKYPSAVNIILLQMVWTHSIESALMKAADKMEEEINSVEKNQNEIMEVLLSIVRGECTTQARMICNTSILAHIYQMEILHRIQSLVSKHQISGVNDFEWIKQIRVKYRKEDQNIVYYMTDCELMYQNKFQGYKERLCFAPDNHKCYITQAQAMRMFKFGGAAGPAGSGKTETIKMFAREIGVDVRAIGCSDQMNYQSMASIFSSMCQTGDYVILDEFNRINIEVISIVALQVDSILRAKIEDKNTFILQGEEIPLIKSCSCFITMNPGYAGRTDLPESVKQQFRSCSMTVTNRRLIIMSKIASEGLKQYELLSHKFAQLYTLCESQLSKQRHYDFGLRNILTVIRMLGGQFRAQGQKYSEENILCKLLVDYNQGRLLARDKSLYMSLISDLFPFYQEFHDQDEASIERLQSKAPELGIILTTEWYKKAQQLIDTNAVRHGIGLLGPSGAGKTKMLQLVSQSLEPKSHLPIQTFTINPNAMNADELYGRFNKIGGWDQGVFSQIFQLCNEKYTNNTNWIILDGSVDPEWVETLNTVLDDNKILVLPNNQRIQLASNCRIIFELENLNNATPATVSRMGIVYVSATDLGWQPLIDSWNQSRKIASRVVNSDESIWLKEFVQQYIKDTNIFVVIKKDYNQMMLLSEFNMINQMLSLLTAVLQPLIDANKNVDKDSFHKLFVYSFAWAFAGVFENEDRIKFNVFLESLSAPIPFKFSQEQPGERATVFDYFIDTESCEWKLWQPGQLQLHAQKDFSQLLIPTSESKRIDFIMHKIASLYQKNQINTSQNYLKSSVLVGSPGTTKTTICRMYSSNYGNKVMSIERINFTSSTDPAYLCENVEKCIEQKQGNTYGPLSDKKQTFFIDDISMCPVNKYGDQHALEQLRLLIEKEGYYFLQSDQIGNFKTVMDLQFISTMNHPGGGKNGIPNRLLRHFFAINITPPSQRAVESIYGKILKQFFNPENFEQEIIDMIQLIIDSSIAIWLQVQKDLRPTPTKFHYNFTIREIARVFNTITKVAQDSNYKVIQNCSNYGENIRSELYLIALWRHECQRTFSDKLINDDDKKCMTDILDSVTKDKFQDNLGFDLQQLLTKTLFCNFQREDEVDQYGDIILEAPLVYEAIQNIEQLKEICQKKLESYNQTNNTRQIDIVLFDVALSNLLKISRVISTPQGHMMLVASGGSGRQSLTKLAAFIQKQKLFQITLTQSYELNDLRQDMKGLFRESGMRKQLMTFMVTESDIKSESFIDLINGTLTSGEVPGLNNKTVKEEFANEFRTIWQQENPDSSYNMSADELYGDFLNRVQVSIHFVLIFSPIGGKLSERSQKFPSVFSYCQINWMAPWPEEALILVTQKLFQGFQFNCTLDVLTNLEKHLAKCHTLVQQVCQKYQQRLRRNVYFTPKNYLSFVNLYKQIYKDKYESLDKEETNTIDGLNVLNETSAHVDSLKEQLIQQQSKLKHANQQTDNILKDLQVQEQKAKEKEQQVAIEKQNCIEQRNQVMIEKQLVDENLKEAMTFLKKAEVAVNSIVPRDINELKLLNKSVDMTKLVMDTIHLLFYRPLDKAELKTHDILNQEISFLADSYDNHTKGTLKGPGFLQDLQHFSQNDKDIINEETIELLQPYFELQNLKGQNIFVSSVAKKCSPALESVCEWVTAMSSYNEHSKIVKPKIVTLEKKMSELKEAEDDLLAAEDQLLQINELKNKIRLQFDENTAKKNEIEQKIKDIKSKVDRAIRLINSLKENKQRWEIRVFEFKNFKRRLIGDVAKSCAFVTYCGPFNFDYRNQILNTYFQSDIQDKDIPISDHFDLFEFLTDQVTIGKWNLKGLPADQLSTQNGIIVTKCLKFPLLIDPQGQASKWIKNKDSSIVEKNCVFTLTHPDLKSAFQLPLEEGLPVLIESIENDVDPLLDPILKRQIIIKGRTKHIIFCGQEMKFNDEFNLYLTSRLQNPSFSPELASKTTIIDFTITQDALELQLLSQLIGMEKKSLEDELQQLNEEINQFENMLQTYEEQLLKSLSQADAATILDNKELIEVLQTIVTKSKEVKEKLNEQTEKKKKINEEREIYRPVAARGAILYFSIIEIALLFKFYNISFQVFQLLYQKSIFNSEKADQADHRVNNIIIFLTKKVFRYVNQGLFERHKQIFKFLIATKIMVRKGSLKNSDVDFFLKVGSGIDESQKPSNQDDNENWKNQFALQKHQFATQQTCFFENITQQISSQKQAWQKWINMDDLENIPIPIYEEQISKDEKIGHFLRLCLIRSFREDRTVFATDKFILSQMGEEFDEKTIWQLQEAMEDANNETPILFTLSPGADPQSIISKLVHQKNISDKYHTISYGQGMGNKIIEMYKNGSEQGWWVFIQNCHLGPAFFKKFEDQILQKDKPKHKDFRMMLSSDPSDNFPLGLIQMSVKVTTEKPQGLKGCLQRSYGNQNQEYLQQVEPNNVWKRIVYTLSVLHACLLERRKFGSLGFIKSLSFDDTDLSASLNLIEQHFSECTANKTPYQWKLIQYIVGEILYGNKALNINDSEVIQTYCQIWLTDKILSKDFSFNKNVQEFNFGIPNLDNIDQYRDHISSLPSYDNPMIFGLHPNANITFQNQDAKRMLDQLMDIRPKNETDDSASQSIEDVVKHKLINDIIPSLPQQFVQQDVQEKLKNLVGPQGLGSPGNYDTIPINQFIQQEIEKFTSILIFANQIMKLICSAIEGTSTMTIDIVTQIDQIFNFKVPNKLISQSWASPTLSQWIQGLQDRHYQLNMWLLNDQRPPSHWIPGFMNPESFFVAVKQEITRINKTNQWSIDDVEFVYSVQKEFVINENGRLDDQNIQQPDMGVKIHGLYLEGASWDIKNSIIVDQKAKQLFQQFPIIHISCVQKCHVDQQFIKTAYYCPVFKYTNRMNQIHQVYLNTVDTQVENDSQNSEMMAKLKWKLSGTALICHKE